MKSRVLLATLFVVVAYVLFTGVVHAMDNNALRSIRNWKQVTPFAGKFVAYTATTYYLATTTYQYLLPVSNCSYGYVENRPSKKQGCGEGYQLRQLLKKDGIPGATVLANEFIEKGSLCMRAVTSQEAHEIIEAINLEKANFAYTWGDEEKKMISHLECIAQQKK